MANKDRANRWLELVAEDMSVAEDLYNRNTRMKWLLHSIKKRLPRF